MNKFQSLQTKRGQEWKGQVRDVTQVVCKECTYEPEAFKLVILVIGAFVEARSLERFYALGSRLQMTQELGRGYRYLLKSESRHYEDYLTLALMSVKIDCKVKRSRGRYPKAAYRANSSWRREKDLILSPDKTFLSVCA